MNLSDLNIAAGDLPVPSATDAAADEVARAKTGEAAVWSAWYDRYYVPLYRYACARLASREEAEDIASQTFLEALRSIRSYTYRGRPVLAWLYVIARNLVASRLRQKRRARYAAARLQPAAETSPEASLEAIELRHALERLTDDQREVIVLRFFLSLPVKEVARLLGKKEEAVASLQVRGIAALRKHLGPGENSRQPE